MADFPALSVQPSVTNWKEKKAADPTVRVQTEGGYTQTRPRYTRIPKVWEVAYVDGNALPLADKSTLEAFETAVQVGAAMFNWTNPMDATVYVVRLKSAIEFAPLGSKLYWSARLTLEQV